MYGNVHDIKFSKSEVRLRNKAKDLMGWDKCH